MCIFSILYSFRLIYLKKISIVLGIMNCEPLNTCSLNILSKVLLVLTSLVRIIFSYWLYLLKTLAAITETANERALRDCLFQLFRFTSEISQIN